MASEASATTPPPNPTRAWPIGGIIALGYFGVLVVMGANGEAIDGESKRRTWLAVSIAWSFVFGGVGLVLSLQKLRRRISLGGVLALVFALGLLAWIPVAAILR